MTEGAPPPVPAKSLFARAIGVILSPKATFEAVVAHPKPIGILFVTALVIGLSTGLPQFTERGQQAAVDAQVQAIEQFTKQPVSDEAYQQMRSRASLGAYWAIIGTLISMPVVSLIFTAIYWVVFNAILGGTATFKQVLTVVTHSQVIGALGALLAAPVQYAQGATTMAGPFNLAVLVPMLDEGSFLVKVLGATSLFTIWGLIVSAIGFGVLYRRKTRNIAITLIVIYFAIVAGVLAVVASFTGS
jgi:hypothetical protein